MLDEGKFSVVRRAFEKEGLTPDVRYFVYDDYTIFVHGAAGARELHARMSVGARI